LFNVFLKLSVEAREEMTRKAIKTIKHFIEKPRKRNSEEDPQEGRGSQATYPDALAHLETSLAHLETLSHSFILSLRNSEQVWSRHPGRTDSDSIAIFFPFPSKALCNCVISWLL
jgi:hypothetical protein